MKIAVIDTTISGELIGGAQTFLVGLLHGLVNRGDDVHFVTSGEPNEKLRGRVESSGAAIHEGLWERSALVEDSAPILAKWINMLKPDVFLISVCPDIGWAVLPRLNPEIATLTIGHSDSRTFYDPLRHYVQFITRVIGVSQEICVQFENYCGLPPERIIWIPYGVEASPKIREDAAGEKLNLVYVGRLAEEDKKASDLIKIAKLLSNRGIDYGLRVIGDGPLMPKFNESPADEIDAGTVMMLGWLNSDELLGHLRDSEVSLLVSESEGFCIALVEAMANGCCPIVTDIESGNKQLVEDGINGFVVPVGDVEGFVDKIKFLAGEPERLQQMREKAWHTGRQYSVERMVDNYVSCFERAIEDNRSNPRTPDANFPLMESCRSKYPLWLRRLKAKVKMSASN